MVHFTRACKTLLSENNKTRLTFEKQQEKNKNIICRPWSVRIEKNCALGLEHGPRPAASGRTQDLWHSFSQYGPPGRQIPFRNDFQGKFYVSWIPSAAFFPNSKSCLDFDEFISSTILDRVKNGSLLVWGKVGSVQPPHLVGPITVEPTKPRMCHVERFLNLWIKDLPLSLDYISGLPWRQKWLWSHQFHLCELRVEKLVFL